MQALLQGYLSTELKLTFHSAFKATSRTSPTGHRHTTRVASIILLRSQGMPLFHVSKVTALHSAGSAPADLAGSTINFTTGKLGTVKLALRIMANT